MERHLLVAFREPIDVTHAFTFTLDLHLDRRLQIRDTITESTAYETGWCTWKKTSNVNVICNSWTLFYNK